MNMDILSRLQSEFGDAVSPRAASENDAVDDVQPQVIAVPRDEAAAQALVHFCGRENIAFVPRGGGTKLHIGAPPSRCDLIISTENLTQIFDHDEGNATVQAGAGISLYDLDQAVAKQNQFVPLAGSETWAPTLGGTISSNYSAYTAAKYGTPRDLVTGLHAVLSDGRLVKAGSKVVKNVSGYDLNKLFVGSFGSLGFLTEITIRLRPNVSCRKIWEDAFMIYEEAEELALEILSGPFEPTLLCLEDRGGIYHLSAHFEGGISTVETQISRLPQPQVKELNSIYKSGEWQLRAHLPVSVAQHWFFEVDNQKAGHIAWDCVSGVVRANYWKVPDRNEILKLRAEAEKLGGFLIVEKAPVEVKTPELVWGKPRPDFALMKKLKQSFDAANVCAPGRFMGGL